MAHRPEFLDQPATEGARALLLALLDEARPRAPRLADEGDVGALHDFRVSVRRLRSALRSWRGVLGRSVRDKDLRRLRRVARATGEARDTEVLLAWIDGMAGDLPAAHRPAAGWIARRLGAGRHEADLSRAVERFAAAAGPLSRRLSRPRAGRGEETFGKALARRIRKQAGAVSAWISRVEVPADAPVAHRARIAGKRLRYLIEPLRDAPGAAPEGALKALKHLQDLLGELNDARLASDVLRSLVAEAEAGRRSRRKRAGDPDPLPGLVALQRRAERRASNAFGRLRREVLAAPDGAPLAPAVAIAAALEARGHRTSGVTGA
jgi:CHAD domain-containing protein